MGGTKKKKPRSLLARIFEIKNWKLIIILILMLFLSASLLRLDHIEMDSLRHEVLATDAKENVTDQEIIDAINKLKEFTSKHIIVDTYESNGVEWIRFSTGRIVLANSYYRKADEILKKAQTEADNYVTNPNGNIYRQVADICDAQGKRNHWAYPDPRYINCWQDELAKFPSSDELKSQITAEMPSADLYEYEFVSPYWYPCASGFAILACIILILLILIRSVIWIGSKILIFITSRIS